MSLEAESTPETRNSQELGSFGVCLVDGNAEQQRRERRVRRRALAISVFLQGLALTLLLLFPLFGKTERIVVKGFVPVPPYGHPTHHPGTGDTSTRHNGPTITAQQFIVRSPTAWVRRPPVDGAPIPPEEIGPAGTATTEGPNCTWCVNVGEQSKGPFPPPQQGAAREKPPLLKMASVDPAMLIRRVEPVYPALAKHIHKEGRVELRAIIATDGTIQSVQVVSGDPLFIQSAMEAVQQWRFKPTYLNGQPVDIDTFITIFYKLSD